MALAALGTLAERDAERTEKIAEREARGETRALTVAEIAAKEANRNAPGWGSYRSSLTVEDMEALQGVRGWKPDARRISPGLLSVHLTRAASRYCARYSKTDRESLRTEALLLIVEWSSVGAPSEALAKRCESEPTPARRVLTWIKLAPSSVVDLGGADALPLRRVWLERDAHGSQVLTRDAWRAMRAALMQASRSQRRFLATLDAAPEELEAVEGEALGRLAERDASLRMRESDRPGLPDAHLAERWADALGVSLSASRSLVYRAHALTPSEASDLWGIDARRVSECVSRGAREVLKRWPNPSDLLRAIDDALPKLRASLEQSATLALADWRDGYAEEDAARVACSDWRGQCRTLPERERVLLAAARLAARRNGRTYGATRAERVASGALIATGAAERDARARWQGSTVALSAPLLSASTALRPMNVRDPMFWPSESEHRAIAQRAAMRDAAPFPAVYAWRYRSGPPSRGRRPGATRNGLNPSAR